MKGVKTARLAWETVLRRYGSRVTVEGETVQAILQSVRDNAPQLPPTPIGMSREERVLYLGPASRPLSPRETVLWEGAEYEVRTARIVGDGHHVRALLQRKQRRGDSL